MRGSARYVEPTVHLLGLPVFEGLASYQVIDLAAEAREVMLPRGSSLLRRGEIADATHLVIDGFVDAGQDLVVGPGGMVGLLETLASAPSPIAAIATTDVTALRIETDALRGACQRHFAVLLALLAYVADRALDERHPLLRSIVGRSARPMPQDQPLDRVGRIVALHRSPVFPSQSMDALAELAASLEEVRLEPGEALWRAGQGAFGFYVVCAGDVHLGGGPWREGDHLGPGSVPGLMATLAGRAYEYEAFASEPTTLLLVRSGSFFDVMEDHFEMVYELLGRIARNLLEAGEGGSTVESSVAEDSGSGRAAW